MADIRKWRERLPAADWSDGTSHEEIEARDAEIAELRAALNAANSRHERMIETICLRDQRTKDALAALPDAIKAVRSAVDVNDGDTLASMSRDDSIILVASGSWNGCTAVTLGHLRTIARAHNPLLEPLLAAATAPQQPAQDKPAALTREQIAKVAGGSMEPSRYHFFMAKIDSAMRAAPDTGGTG